jgi:hypothetical protein
MVAATSLLGAFITCRPLWIECLSGDASRAALLGSINRRPVK